MLRVEITPYTSPHKATQGGLVLPGTFIPTTPVLIYSTVGQCLTEEHSMGLNPQPWDYESHALSTAPHVSSQTRGENGLICL